MYQLFYSAIVLWGIYPKKKKKTDFHMKSCSGMSIVVLFLIARKWKQPKSPLTGGWIKKLSLTRTEEYYSVTRKKRNSDICNYMDKP